MGINTGSLTPDKWEVGQTWRQRLKEAEQRSGLKTWQSLTPHQGMGVGNREETELIWVLTSWIASGKCNTEGTLSQHSGP